MNQAIRIVCAGLLAGAVAYGEVVTWPAAPGTAATNGAFTVKVNGRPVDVIEIPKPTHCLKDADAHPYYAAFFDADEEVDVEVVGAADMRRTRMVGFRAKPPFNVAVEPSGRHGALVIAANVPERDAPKKDDPNVVYFGPGRHRRDKAITLGSGQTLYLAPGAYVEGWVKASGTNMTIRGRGILSGLPWQWGKGPVGWMVAAQGRDIVVKDVTLMSSWTWMLVFNEAENVLVDNIKLFNGRTLNDDGIDICRSRHVAIRNSFIRSQDDCIAPKYWCEDLTVENCALWTDVANIIRVHPQRQVDRQLLDREHDLDPAVQRRDVREHGVRELRVRCPAGPRPLSNPPHDHLPVRAQAHHARRPRAQHHVPGHPFPGPASAGLVRDLAPFRGSRAHSRGRHVREPRGPGGVPRARGHPRRGEEHQGPAVFEVSTRYM